MSISALRYNRLDCEHSRKCLLRMCACYMPQPLYLLVINANTEWTGCCECVGAVRVVSERGKTCEACRIYRCKPYKFWIQRYHILNHTASQTEGSLPTQHHDNVTARPPVPTGNCTAVCSVCQLSQLSRLLEQGDSKTMDCTHEGGRQKMEGLGGEMRYG